METNEKIPINENRVDTTLIAIVFAFMIMFCVMIAAFFMGFDRLAEMKHSKVTGTRHNSQTVAYPEGETYETVVTKVKNGNVYQAVIPCGSDSKKELLDRINQDGLKMVGTIVTNGNTVGFVVEKVR